MWVYEFEGIMPSNFLSFCPKDLEKGACNDKTKTGQPNKINKLLPNKMMKR